MTRARLTVGALTAMAVAASGMALAAPAATAYGPASSTLHCRLYFSDSGTGSSPSTYTDNLSISVSPALVKPGSSGTVTVSGATGATSGPVPITAGSMTMRVTLQATGANSGAVSLVSAPYPAVDIPAYTATGAWSASGTVAFPEGTTDLALRLVKMDDSSSFNVDTYCADAPDADFRATQGVVSATVHESVSTADAWATGVRSDGSSPVGLPTLALHVGDAIDVDGDASWTASAPLYATVCSGDDTTSCAPPAVQSSVLAANGGELLPAVDGSGELTAGSLKLMAIQTPGPAYVQLWQGTINPGGFSRVVTKHVNIPVRLLGERTVAPGAGTVLEGEPVSVTGTGWYPGEQVVVSAGTAPLGTVTADATGAISTSGAAIDPAATSVYAAGIGGFANGALTVTPISSVLTGTYGLSPQTVWLSQKTTITPSAIGGAVATVTVNWGDLSAVQPVSTTAATTHTYAKAGTFPVTATFAHSNGRTTVKNLGSVLVKKDTLPPHAWLLLPAKAKRPLVASWKTLRGTTADTGLGPKNVLVTLTEKRGALFYYYTGRAWAKAASAKVAALRAAKVSAAVAANKTWALGVKGLTKGTLTITYRAVDKAGNVGKATSFVQVLVR